MRAFGETDDVFLSQFLLQVSSITSSSFPAVLYLLIYLKNQCRLYLGSLPREDVPEKNSSGFTGHLCRFFLLFFGNRPVVDRFGADFLDFFCRPFRTHVGFVGNDA